MDVSENGKSGWIQAGWQTFATGSAEQAGRLFLQEHKQEKAAFLLKAQYLVRALEKAMKQGFGTRKPSKAQLKQVQIALGNIDNRLTQAQYSQALRFSDPAKREAFIRGEHQKNVVGFKADQQAALNSLPAPVREAVNELRRELDLQTQELLRDPGLDANLKARISTDGSVFSTRTPTSISRTTSGANISKE